MSSKTAKKIRFVLFYKGRVADYRNLERHNYCFNSTLSFFLKKILSF